MLCMCMCNEMHPKTGVSYFKVSKAGAWLSMIVQSNFIGKWSLEWWMWRCSEIVDEYSSHSIYGYELNWLTYYAHGRQRRCQEDPVSLPSGRLEKTTRSSPHHVAQHHPTGSKTTPPYAPRSSRFGSEPPSVEDDVDIYAIVSCMPETTTTMLVGIKDMQLVKRSTSDHLSGVWLIEEGVRYC